MKKKCRVFTKCLGWSEVMFIFDEETKFQDIQNHPQTHMITREDFIGTYDFDKKFISFFEKDKIKDKYYFFRFSYQKDYESQEKVKWKPIPEIPIKKEVVVKEHKNIKVDDGF